MTQPIRLLLADDHAVMREGLAALLEDEPDFTVIAQAGNGREALALILRHRPDIALLDITMPDNTGLEVASRVAVIAPEVKTLILTMHEEEAFFFEALRVGAAGYVLKGVRSEELVGAIRVVHEGGVYLPPKLAGRLVRDYLEHQPQALPDDALTAREREVLARIAQGLSNTDIAQELTLSVNTVKTHRLHIYQKLNLHDRADLIEYAWRQGLFQR